jgi:hypothetical protein
MVKKEALTTEERSELLTFVGESVFENRAFPSMKLGHEKVTIQELLHERSDEALATLGKQVKKAIADYDPDFSSTTSYKVGGVDADRFVRILKLILKHREYEKYKASLASTKKLLQAELENFKTPEEKKKEIEAKLAALDA